MKFLLLISILFFAPFVLVAQTNPPQDIGTIEQNLRKLDVLGSVLYVAAHPDDENTRLLAYLAQEKHYRTGYLSITRGDGGQNLIGNEQGELLGLVRTQELLAARKVDGAEQFFTRAIDFGFSKGPKETLDFWNKEQVLGDVVWVIRKFRPDVIICRFPTTGEGGHGNHTASAMLAQEAFSAAADPNRFPEQLKYVQVWQPKRLMWNTFNFGSTNTTAPDQFKVNVGVYNPILGKGYGELAAESRSNHKTQGFGSARQRGDAFEYFKTILGEAPKDELMDGVNTSWSRVEGGEKIGKEVEAIRQSFDVNHPEMSVKALEKLYVAINGIDNPYWKAQKLKEVGNLLTACAGLWFEAYASEPIYALGDSAKVSVQIYSPHVFGSTAIRIHPYGAGYESMLTSSDGPILQQNNLTTISFSDDEPKLQMTQISQPYWLVMPHNIGSYALVNDTLAGNPSNPDVPKVLFEFNIENGWLKFERPIMYKYTDPAKGELYQPLVIAPPITANIQNAVYIFNSQQPQNIAVKLQSFKDSAGGTIRLKAPAGWNISPSSIPFAGKKKGDEWTENFALKPTGSQSQTSAIETEVTVNGYQQTFNNSILSIQYNHIPNITIFPQAKAKLLQLDLKIAGKKIGYIMGAGDLVPDALRQVGYDVHLLTESEIESTDLSAYDAIVVGVRAYNVKPRLAVEQPKLLEYVKNGGNLVVQYNNNAGLVTKQIGPYPFNVVNQRVTDETAKINILDPENPVLNYPNKVTQNDFDGWIQERGLYFTKDADPQYHRVLQMADPGEAPVDGALITTSYGKGRFVYTSLAFFRQLPAGVPGAYRLFINMLSKPKANP